MPRILSDDDVLKFINLPSKLEQTPREIIESDFKSIGSIPIKGGWGYTKDDAVIIDKDDHSVPKDMPFNGIGIEKIFVEKRTYEELIIFRTDGDKFNGIEWELLNQSLVQDNDKYYDVLKYKICGHLDGDWEFLKEEFERNDFFSDDPEGKDNHFEEHSNRLICYETEFWFDITSFFGKSLADTDPVQEGSEFEFTKMTEEIEDSFEFFNLVRLRLIPGLPRNFNESDTGPHKVVQVSCFEENVADQEGETFEILSVVVADASNDPEEPDFSQLSNEKYLAALEEIRSGTLKIWGPEDFEWSPPENISLKNGLDGVITQFTYRDRVKRFNFALRFTYQNTKLVIMYQLNEEVFSLYANDLRNLIENVEFI